MRESMLLTLLRYAIPRRQSDRYVIREWLRLLRGKRHTVLGNAVKDEAETRREAGDFLLKLRRLSLQPTDRCIEIGCGALWAAEPVIGFLQPGNFLGLDVTDIFFNAGIQRLPKTLEQEKRPQLAVISPKSLEQARGFRANFIFSRKTLIHVPPAELAAFLDQACSLMAPATICAHEMPPISGSGHQFNRYSWAYSLADLRAALPGRYALEYRENAFVIRHGQIRQ